MRPLGRRAITKITAALVIVIILGAAVVGIYYTSISSTTSQTSTASSAGASSMHDTLVVDDSNWPAGDLNQLYAELELPWPDYLAWTVYQPLVAENLTAEYQQGISQFSPGLASNWTVSTDGTTYTFNLRQVSFSNGDPFNAYQFWMEQYGFYYLAGNTSSWVQGYPIFDTSKVNFGPATIAFINENGGLIHPSQSALNIMMNSSWPIYVTGPYQIVFRMTVPFRWFLNLMVVYQGLVFDTQWALDHGGFGTPAAYNPYFNQNPIPGSGPYVVAGVGENNFVRLTQNPSYWGANLTQPEITANPLLDPGHARTILIYYRPDDVVRYTDLSKGTAQIATITSSDWNLVTANPDKYSFLVNRPGGGGGFEMLDLNTQLYPTNITDVRLAIVHAINYSDISQKAFHGYLSPWIGPSYPYYPDLYNLANLAPYTYNVTLAQQYLADAKLSNIPPLTLKIGAGIPSHTTAAEVIQSDLAQIGLTVNIVVVPESQLLSSYGALSTEITNPGQYGNMGFGVGVPWYPSTNTPADPWIDFVNNISVWGNSALYDGGSVVQQCVHSFTSTSDLTLIKSLCAKAQAKIYGDAPYAWLGVYQLWDGDGSIVWQKGVVQSFLMDPLFGGQTDEPILNTVTFYPS